MAASSCSACISSTSWTSATWAARAQRPARSDGSVLPAAAGHGEQLGPDALVDVLVEVEGDQLEAGADGGGGFGDGHADDSSAIPAGGAPEWLVAEC